VRERASLMVCVRWECVSVEHSTNGGELTNLAHMHTKWLPAHAANSNTTKHIRPACVCVCIHNCAQRGRQKRSETGLHSHAKAKMYCQLYNKVVVQKQNVRTK